MGNKVFVLAASCPSLKEPYQLTSLGVAPLECGVQGASLELVPRILFESVKLRLRVRGAQWSGMRGKRLDCAAK